MKLRIPNELRQEIEQACDECGFTVSEVICRALRKYYNHGGGAALSNYMQSATRDNSVPVEVNIPSHLRGALTSKAICAIVRWALEQRHPMPRPEIRPSEPCWINGEYVTPEG